VSVLLPAGAALLAAAAGWPASRLIRAYRTQPAAHPPAAASLTAAPLIPAPTAPPTPLVAAAMAVLTFGAAALVHPWLVAVATCWFAVCAVPLAIIDAMVRRLPDPLTGAAFAGIAACLTAEAGLTGRWLDLARAGGGALAVAGLFLLLAVVRPGSAGLGDAKLGLSVGALAGWLGWGVLVDAVLAAFLLAACYGGWLLAVRRTGLRASLAFGPFLLAGCLAAVLLAR
jgi:leader peptidase (prepilin peptidase) / N-methyltransferase